MLTRILDKAKATLSEDELKHLDERWFWSPAEMSKPSLRLTADEKAWLAKNPVLRMGYDIDWPPIEQLEKDGRYVGLSADFFSIIANRLGITIEPAMPTDWASMLELAKKGEMDLMSAVVQTPQRDDFLDFTHPYLTFPMVIVEAVEKPYF